MTEESDGELVVSDLRVDIAGAEILHGVSFAMAGGVTVIVGRNGMGKTTLCDAVVGFRQVNRGSVTFRDVGLDDKPPHQIARLGVSYVPQGRRLFPSLTVREHMRIAARRSRRRPGRWTVDGLYDMFPNLARARDRRAGQLSGGEQQMLAISRALLTQPKLIVLDEPSEGLAPVIIENIVDVLKNLKKESDISLLVIEQNLGVAVGLADELWVMSSGELIDHVRSDVLMSDEGLQERYLGVR